MKELTARVSNIQRFSVHDGPGIRTVVFLMGCPLRCKWCQNPEMFTPQQKLMFLGEKCIGCGACAQVCVTGARELIDKERTVSEVEKAVLSDAVFYRQSHGGVTVSGGEATMHAEFVTELFARLHTHGIHTAMETSGHCDSERFLKAATQTDLLLYDVKHTDSEMHRTCTGVGNELIRKNLWLAGEMGKQIVIRIPLIPGKNDSDENMRKTGQIAKEVGAKEIHILPFHQLGQAKWRDSGQDYTMADLPEAGEETVARCAAVLRETGLPVNIGGHGMYDFLK